MILILRICIFSISSRPFAGNKLNLTSHMISRFFLNVLYILVVLAVTTNLGRLFHIFAILLVEYYLHKSHIEQFLVSRIHFL